MVVVDTSAWMAYFQGRGEVISVLEKELRLTPAIVLAELARALKNQGKSDETIQEVISLIKRQSTILALDENNAVLSGVLSVKNHFDFVDGVIYSYASNDHKVVSTDSDFKNKPFAVYVDLKKRK